MYSKQQKDPTKKQLIVGWVQTKKEYQHNLDSFSRELLDKEKVAVSKYSDYAGLYFIHPAMVRRDLFKKLDWKVRTPKGHSELPTPLLYVIYLRRPLVPGFSMMIEPEFIGVPDVKEELRYSPERKFEIEEPKQNFSPITDEGDVK